MCKFYFCIFYFCIFYFFEYANSIQYQFDPRIHTLGNIGFGGAFHATISPLCTKAIDILAYDKVDLRELIKNEYASKTGTLDLCSGTGISSTDYGISVDTSKYMIDVAKFLHSGKHRHHYVANAEDIYAPRQIVTCMFSFHEIPREGRIKIIKNSIKNARKRVVIVDIHEDYKPSTEMLMGEPYIKEYLANVKIDILGVSALFGKKMKYYTVIPKHVQAWIIEM